MTNKVVLFLTKCIIFNVSQTRSVSEKEIQEVICTHHILALIWAKEYYLFIYVFLWIVGKLEAGCMIIDAEGN